MNRKAISSVILCVFSLFVFVSMVSAQEADSALFEWPVGDPGEEWFESSLDDTWISAWKWPEGADLHLCVGSGGYPASIDPGAWTTECDLFQDNQTVPAPGGEGTQVIFDTSPHMLVYGDYVTVSDGVTAKYHQMTELEILVVDPVLDLISGTSAPGQEINAYVHDCVVTEIVYADGSGDWSADFSGTCDIVPGSSGSVWEWDADGDNSYLDWGLPNPRIEAYLLHSNIDGVDWPEGADLHLCVGSAGYPASIDPAAWTTECDLYQDNQTVPPPDGGPTRVEYFTSPHVLSAGEYITISDGVTAKYHQVDELDLVLVDPDLDLVTGTSAPGEEIEVKVYNCGVTEFVTADLGGDWTADFSGTCDIELGFWGGIWDFDGDGDSSILTWHLPNPWIEAYLNEPNIDAVDWPEGADLHLCVGSGGFPVSADPSLWTTECDLYQDNDTVPPPDGGPTRVHYDTSPHVLSYGDYVTVSDGVIAKHHQMTELVLLSVDPDTDIISGTAAVGREVQVEVHDCGAGLPAIADGSGDWAADFSGTCDIQYGFEGTVWDPEDGGYSIINWRLPNTRIEAFLNIPYIDAEDWPEGADVHVCVGSGGFPASADPSLWTTECDLYQDNQIVQPGAGEASFEISPLALSEGDYVTASDGVTAKFHQMTGLTLTSVDPDTNIISGTAAAGAEISVWVRECDVVENVIADGGGDWAIDFTTVCDIEPGYLGKVWDLDPDNDASTILWTIPNPWIEAYIDQPNIDAADWPEGADLHLCVGSGGFPASIDPGAWTTECDLYQGNQIAPNPLFDRAYFESWPHVIAQGDYVTVSDGALAKHHQVSELTLVSVDPAADVITGTSGPGEEIQVNVWDCGAEEYVFADPGGDWLADFSSICDIQPGSEGSVRDPDEDGDASNINWRVPDPWVEVYIGESYIPAEDWPLGAEVYLCVGSVGFPASIDPGAWTTECDIYQDNQTVYGDPGGGPDRAEFDTSPHILGYGDYVTVSDGVTAKHHQVTELELVSVDPDLDLITGRAEAGKEIWVYVWDCDYGEPVITDPGGDWSADFTGTCDINLGFEGHVRDWDDDGDSSNIHWRVPNTRIEAFLNIPFIDAEDWPEGADVHVCVGTSGFPGPDPAAWTTECDLYQDMGTVPPEAGEVTFEISPLSLSEGDYVTASDGVTAKFHQMTGLTLTSVDPDTNIISGTAAAGAEISVWVRECDVVEHVIADGGGDWAIDFSPTCSIEPGFLGKVWDLDSDNDASTILWTLPNPWIEVYLDTDSIDAVDWPEGADLHLCVGSGGFPASADPSLWTTECDLYQDNQIVPPIWEGARVNYYTSPHIMGAGDYVTVSDGVMAKYHQVTELGLVSVDPDLDLLIGTAAPDKELWVEVWDCGTGQNVFADPGGDWAADFSGICDIEPGFEGSIWDPDEDGDASILNWRVPRPNIDAFLHETYLEAADWPEGADIHLCVGSGGFPASIDPGEWTLECDLYQDNQTMPPPEDGFTWVGFDIFPHVLSYGDYVTVTDGVTAKHHQMTELELLVIDTDLDLLSGTAAPGKVIEVQVWDCDGQEVVTDPGGDWVADFSGMCDIDLGSEGQVRDNDDDGDTSVIHWRLPYPYLQAEPIKEWIQARSWPLGNELHFCVNEGGFAADPTNELNCSVFHTTAIIEEDPEVPDDTFVEVSLDGEDLQPGHYISVTDGVTEKQLLVSDLEILDIDLTTDMLSGTATPNSELGVEVYEDCPDCWQLIVAAGDGSWAADFSGVYDIGLGTQGAVSEFDLDFDVTRLEWRIPRPWIHAMPDWDAILAYDWPLAAEVHICVNEGGFAADPTNELDCSVFYTTGIIEVSPEGPEETFLEIGLEENDLLPGHYITITDGSTAVEYQVSFITITDIDLGTSTFTGTAAPYAEISIDIHGEDCWLDTVADEYGDWSISFDGIYSLSPGNEGAAFENEENGVTSVSWRIPNPQIHAQPQFDGIYGNDWPEGELLHVCVDSTGFTGDPTDPLNCDIYHGTALSEFNPDAGQTEAPFDLEGEDLQPGHYITMTDGETLKELLVSDIHVTSISVDLDTISGTGTPDSEISVGIHDDCPGCWRGLVSDGSGDWTADFSGDYDLVPGSNGYIDEYDEDGDVTYIQWNIINPYLSAEPFNDRLSGFDWPAASEVYTCIDTSAFAPEGVSPDLWTSLDCDLYLDSVITTQAPFNPIWYWFQIDLDGVVDLTAGLFITAADGVHRKTLEITDLRVLGTDHNNQLVLGTAEPGSEIHQTTFGAYPDFSVAANPDGTWAADYSGFPGWDYGTQGYSHQQDADGDHTWIKWENFQTQIYVNPDQELVYGNGFILDTEVNLFVDETWVDSMIAFPNPYNELRGRVEFDLSGSFDLLSGQNVCLRDVLGIRERCHVVEFLEVTMVDPIHDEISGNAEEGKEVRVGVDGFPEIEEIAIADAFDQWQIGFGPPIELETTSTGYAQINYGLGEGTWVYWGYSPEMDVLGNGISIMDGDITPDPSDDTDFGSLEVMGGIAVTHTFTIGNAGPGNLYLYDSPRVQISGAHATDFTVIVQPLSLVHPAGSTIFQVSFEPSAAGLREAEVSIANNDSDENPYTFAIEGVGLVPEMDVQGNGVSIADGDNTPSAADDTDFGSTNLASGSVVHTFTIENTGPVDLALTGDPKVEISGAHAGDFTVTSQPSSPVAWGGGTTTFEITFDPSYEGLREAEVSIANTDSDENPYNFSIQGTGVLPVPEMDVQGNAQSIADGDSTPSVSDDTDFGSAVVATDVVVHTFTIENTGDAVLSLLGDPKVEILGPHAVDFIVTYQPPSSSVPPGGGTTTFEITFAPTTEGLREAVVSIDNNDSDEDPYNFSIQGTGALVPEMDVQGNGQSITDGDSTPSASDDTDFGTADVVSGTAVHTFTIRNFGGELLNLTGVPKVDITGAHTADFIVTSQPASPVAAGGGTTFEITFNPSAEGLRTATVSIDNDDSDENPYDFAIQGTGTTPVPPRTPTDFDGDGLADPAKFYSSTGVVWWLESTTSTWDSAWLGSDSFDYVRYSDFDGDGKTDPGKFSSTNGTVWYIKSSTGTWEGKFLGVDTYTYVGGNDFEGDGASDPTKLLPNGAIWYLKSSTGVWEGFWLGPEAFECVAGSDFDGDGITDPAKFIADPGVLWYWKSSTSGWVGVFLGSDAYSYVSASDFDGDGKTDPAKFYASTGVVWWLKSTTGTWDAAWMGSGTYTFVGGNDFDGDGLTDPAKYDPSTGYLYWLKSSTSTWDSAEMGTDAYELIN